MYCNIFELQFRWTGWEYNNSWFWKFHHIVFFWNSPSCKTREFIYFMFSLYLIVDIFWSMEGWTESFVIPLSINDRVLVFPKISWRFFTNRFVGNLIYTCAFVRILIFTIFWCPPPHVYYSEDKSGAFKIIFFYLLTLKVNVLSI